MADLLPGYIACMLLNVHEVVAPLPDSTPILPRFLCILPYLRDFLLALLGRLPPRPLTRMGCRLRRPSLFKRRANMARACSSPATCAARSAASAESRGRGFKVRASVTSASFDYGIVNSLVVICDHFSLLLSPIISPSVVRCTMDNGLNAHDPLPHVRLLSKIFITVFNSR